MDDNEKLAIIAKNISRSDRQLAVEYEKRLAHLEERSLLDCEKEEETDPSFTRCLRENLGQMERLASQLLLLDKIESAGFSAGSRDTGFAGGDEYNPGDRQRIIYVRNSYADIAYSVFARQLESPTVAYGGDFENVCEEVFYSRAEYCILPVENVRDGRLQSFRNLIYKYDLKKLLTCDAQIPGGSARLALLGKSVRELPADGVKLIEINLTPEHIGIGAVINAIELFGFSVKRIDTVSVSYSPNEYTYDIVIISGGDREGLREFLLRECPGCLLTGIYTELTN